MSGHDVAADDEADEQELKQLPTGRNYMTPAGWQRMKDELYQLVHKERPEEVNVVSWAAGNGDRSENGDYLYGKKRLREIDRRIRFLSKRIDNAHVVDAERQRGLDRVFFGATVTLCDLDGKEYQYSIVGVDEADASKGHLSWVSPLARALLKAREGDTVRFHTPLGEKEFDVLEVQYGLLD